MKAYNANQLLDYLRQSLFEKSSHRSDSRQLGGAHDNEGMIAICIDSLVEGIHFLQNTPPGSIAHKALAVNLSDLASMGAKPSCFSLGLVLPEWDESWLESFRAGLQYLQELWGLRLLACDVREGPLSVTIEAQGLVYHKNTMLRSGAKPGDQIYVTGSLGDAACALTYLLNDKPLPEKQKQYLLQRLNMPSPRIEAGMLIADIANAAIDVSDGLASDLGHILEESGVGARVDVNVLPASTELLTLLDERHRLQVQLAGGDDYELCFTLPVEHEQTLIERFLTLDVTCTRIGEIVENRGLEFFKQSEKIQLDIKGYDHFAVD